MTISKVAHGGSLSQDAVDDEDDNVDDEDADADTDDSSDDQALLQERELASVPPPCRYYSFACSLLTCFLCI